MKESLLQSKIIKKLKSNGYFVTKLIQTSTNGIPDILAIKDGKSIFIEVKTLNKKPSKLQGYRIKQLESFGAKVFLIDNITQIEKI
jgi:Holliday junction resolvase